MSVRCSVARAPTLQARSMRRPVAASAAATKQGVQFCKYHGLGNDFILVRRTYRSLSHHSVKSQVDNRHATEPVISQEQAVRLCDRNFGIGGDGVIFALPASGDTDYSMRIFNSDGSEPEMCGNGIRCLARFVADIDAAQPRTYRVHTLAGLIQPTLLSDGRVCVDMGPPTLDGPSVPTTLPPTTPEGHVVAAPLDVAGNTWQVTCVSMGNPHAVIFSNNAQASLEVEAIDLASIGPLFERHSVFPARTNTEFVQVLSDSHCRMIVWERGAGRTLACGTGACAVVVAGVLEGRLARSARVDLPGGPLDIEWSEEDGKVYMTGPAEMVFSGSLPEV